MIMMLMSASSTSPRLVGVVEISDSNFVCFVCLQLFVNWIQQRGMMNILCMIFCGILRMMNHYG